MDKFLLTRPSRGATELHLKNIIAETFLLTRPSRGATIISDVVICTCPFLLTRPSRGATCQRSNNLLTVWISTHTPLAGRDTDTATTWQMALAISTHTPLAGRDINLCNHSASTVIFLLTRPSRGATFPSVELPSLK